MTTTRTATKGCEELFRTDAFIAFVSSLELNDTVSLDAKTAAECREKCRANPPCEHFDFVCDICWMGTKVRWERNYSGSTSGNVCTAKAKNKTTKLHPLPKVNVVNVQVNLAAAGANFTNGTTADATF